jgi:hypothetical protein
VCEVCEGLCGYVVDKSKSNGGVRGDMTRPDVAECTVVNEERRST